MRKSGMSRSPTFRYVAQSDIPGLVAEAASPQEMIALVGELVPELLALNSPDDDPVVPYSLMFDHLTARRAVA
jgi:hypothetical protein